MIRNYSIAIVWKNEEEPNDTLHLEIDESNDYFYCIVLRTSCAYAQTLLNNQRSSKRVFSTPMEFIKSLERCLQNESWAWSEFSCITETLGPPSFNE